MNRPLLNLLDVDALLTNSFDCSSVQKTHFTERRSNAMSNASLSVTSRRSLRGYHDGTLRPNLVKYQQTPEASALKYDYTDMMSIHRKLKHLHVGGYAIFENISGPMMLDILKKYKNYRVELVDSYGRLATLCAVGNHIYAVTNCLFCHSKTYAAHPVTVADAKCSDKWFKVYFSGYTADAKVMFQKVKFTRVHFWKRVKAPKVI